MSNVFEGTPDARQAGDIQPTAFSPRYRALSEEELKLHDMLKAKADELLALFEQARILRHPVTNPETPGSIADELRAFPQVEQSKFIGSMKIERLGDLEHRLAPGTYEKTSIGDMSHEVGVLGDDYFGWARKALQESVIWVVKGLTS